MRKLLLPIAFVLSATAFAQNVAINSTGAAAVTSAALDVDMANKGILIPRVALTTTTAFAPVTGTATTSLLVYNTASAGTFPTNVTPGYYYWNGTVWVRLVNSGTAWELLGNAGTTAGTNFIGTIDNISFVTKTNSVERMRILNTGAGVYNAITPFAGDVFSAYGTGYTGAISALGTFVLNGYVGANGVGVYGESNSAAANAGIGVYGNLLGASTATATGSYGVLGTNGTVPAGTGIAVGVEGDATGTTGNARGVVGTTTSGTSMGTGGFNLATTGNGFGVFGQNSSVAGTGVMGLNAAAALTTNTAIGVFGRVQGTLTSGSSIAVRGYSDATTGNGYAFYGQAFSSTATGGIAFVTSSNVGWQGQNAGTGIGVAGFNTNATPGLAGDGVYGQTSATDGMGGFFANLNALGTGLVSSGNNAAAQYVVRGSGIAGTGTQYGVIGMATTTVNTNQNNNSVANAANASAGGYFEVQNAGTAQTWSYVGVRDGGGVLRKIIGTGTVNTIVKDTKGEYVAMSCPEAPENLFQDYGQGQLVNGKIHIDIDPILAKNIVVNEQHPLRVFIQLEGDCEGVFITNKTQTGFDVVELKGGTSNVSFSYTIVANRADEMLPDGSMSNYSAERFPIAPGPQEKAGSRPAKTELLQKPLDELKAMDVPASSANPVVVKKNR